MSGGIIFRQGGPISWTSIRQERTSLSSCEAEIWATNEVSKLVMGICNLADSVRTSGHNINDTQVASPIYNDNKSCIKWSHNMMTKQTHHMEMHKNAVNEWVQDDLLKVVHVSGRLNPADIFTKEMRDGAHFRCLRDSFMCGLSDFLQQSLIEIHHSRQHDEPLH
jgi:hypothetical protein